MLAERPIGKLEQLSYDRPAPQNAYYDEERANHVITMVEKHCRHVEGELYNKPFLLAEWQKHILRNIYGWYKQDGTRAYSTAYISVPRKNGKSALISALGLYGLCFEGEQGAQVVSAASARDQARVVYEAAKRMIELNPVFTRNGVKAMKDIIKYKHSTFKPVSSAAGTLHGLNISTGLIDELHVHPNSEVWDAIETGTGARRNPLILGITTAGVWNPEHVCQIKYEYAKKVLSGEIVDDSYFAYVSEPDEGDDWLDPQTWWKANPNLHVSKKISVMEAESQKAKTLRSQENTFRRLHLNQWVSASQKWLDMDKWDQGKREFSPMDMVGKECYVGVDLASTEDLACVVYVFPGGDGDYYIHPKFFLPSDNIETKGRHHSVPYLAWTQAGFIQATPGDVIDLDAIEQEIVDARNLYQIREVAYDRWGMTSMAPKLAGRGFSVLPVSQGFSGIGGATKEFERLVGLGKIYHNSPVLTWNASNAAVVTDPSENIRVVKKQSFGKVDGIVAAIMGLDRALRNQMGHYSVLGI